ncbi:hypothetical protein [Citrobacter freundii]|uniref:hypothetical protein n=1 Tax=Citrobacter freundii TaxID=546 RepID=UPI00389000A1
MQRCLLRYPGYALGPSELPRAGHPVGGEASPGRAGELGKVRRARRDPSRACPELRTYLQLAPFGLSDFRALGARANRAGPADRQRLAAGRSGPGEPTAETTHPAGAERD